MLDEVYSYPVVKWLVGLLGISMIAAGLNTLMSADKRTLAGFIRQMILGFGVGGVAGLFLHDTDFGPFMQAGIVAVCAIMAEYILTGSYAFFRAASKDPKAFFVDTFIAPLIAAWAGKLGQPSQKDDPK